MALTELQRKRLIEGINNLPINTILSYFPFSSLFTHKNNAKRTNKSEETLNQTIKFNNNKHKNNNLYFEKRETQTAATLQKYNINRKRPVNPK